MRLDKYSETSMEVAEPIARRLVAMWNGSVRVSQPRGAGYLMRRQADGEWSADRYQHRKDLGVAKEAQAREWEAIANAAQERGERGRLNGLSRKCRSGHYDKAILYTARMILADPPGTFGTFR